MKYTLKNKEIELSNEEVAEIVKQNTAPVEEKKGGIQIRNRFTGAVIFQSTKTTLKEAVEEGKANLRGAHLCEASLREADLSEANFIEADLRRANLIEADLCEANLREANLREANLRGAHLYEADLRGANLYGANLYGADLSEADLREADLSEAEMQNVKFFGKGGTTKIKKSQLEDFLKAIGVIMED